MINFRKVSLTVSKFLENSVWTREPYDITSKEASKIIELVLLQAPFGDTYSVHYESKHIIIDGLKRFAALEDFINGEFSLNGLTQFDFNGLTFNDLTRPFQRRIIEAELSMYVIELDDTDPTFLNRINKQGEFRFLDAVGSALKDSFERT